MKERPDDYARLRHILDAIEEVENYVFGMDEQGFGDDSKSNLLQLNSWK